MENTMIRVSINTNTQRKTVVVPSTTVIKAILEENSIDYAGATVHMDGCPLSVQEMNSTLRELGVIETAILSSVMKADNAL